MKGKKVLGIVLCVFMVIAMSSCMFDLDAFGRDVSEEKSFSGSIITGIWVETTIADVTITSTKDEDVSVKLTGRTTSKDVRFSASEENGTVIVKCDPKGWGRSELFLDIAVPETLAGEDIYVDVTTGRISVSDIAVSDGISLKATTGRINVSSVKAYTVDVKTSTGGISLANIDAEESLTAEATTGGISVDCSVLPENIDISTSTGGSTLALPASSSFHIIAKAATGRVNCSGFTFESKDSAGKDRLSGTVKGSSDKMSEIWIESSTGSITIKSR